MASENHRALPAPNKEQADFARANRARIQEHINRHIDDQKTAWRVTRGEPYRGVDRHPRLEVLRLTEDMPMSVHHAIPRFGTATFKVKGESAREGLHYSFVPVRDADLYRRLIWYVRDVVGLTLIDVPIAVVEHNDCDTAILLYHAAHTQSIAAATSSVDDYSCLPFAVSAASHRILVTLAEFLNRWFTVVDAAYMRGVQNHNDFSMLRAYTENRLITFDITRQTVRVDASTLRPIIVNPMVGDDAPPATRSPAPTATPVRTTRSSTAYDSPDAFDSSDASDSSQWLPWEKRVLAHNLESERRAMLQFGQLVRELLRNDHLLDACRAQYEIIVRMCDPASDDDDFSRTRFADVCKVLWEISESRMPDRRMFVDYVDDVLIWLYSQKAEERRITQGAHRSPF